MADIEIVCLTALVTSLEDEAVMKDWVVSLKLQVERATMTFELYINLKKINNG